MEKNKRNGQRKKRGRRRIPELGYYLIVTDTEETEKNYFNGLRESLPESIRDRLVIKVSISSTQKLVESCLNMLNKDPQYRIPWIVFDRDEVKNFDRIITEAKRNGIDVGWSNPCFEIWLRAYFGKMPASISSQASTAEFSGVFKKETNQEYSKEDKDIYKKVNRYGDEEKAINIAKLQHEQFIDNGEDKPSKMSPCTTVYKLVDEIKSKA